MHHTPMQLRFDQAAEYGFVFPGARGWIEPENMAALARDAALTGGVPNMAVPAEFTAYIDPQVIEILTAPRRARELFEESRKGDWTTPYARWRIDEYTGQSRPYSDYGHGGSSDVNSNWATRRQYVFQTSVQYGDREQALSSAARMNLAAAKQRAAATVLDIDANRFYLLGVEGMEIYGLLNDPNLPAAIPALPTGAGNSTAWADKGSLAIYNDILALFAELAGASRGLADKNSDLVLALSPEMSVYLGAATDFNVSVLDMLNKYFRSLDVVTLPELSDAASGETMLLFAREVAGMATGALGFGVKMMAGRLVPELSSFRQKFVASTYGGIIKMPFAFAQMTGMEGA